MNEILLRDVDTGDEWKFPFPPVVPLHNKPRIYFRGGMWHTTNQPFPLALSNELWAPAYSWVAKQNSKIFSQRVLTNTN